MPPESCNSALVRFLVLAVVAVLCGCKTAPQQRVRYDVVYLDMDGTMLDSEKKIRPATLAALHDYARCGGKVGIASGRTLEQVRQYLGDVSPTMPLVLVNGALTYDAQGGKVLGRAGLNAASVPAVMKAVTDPALKLSTVFVQFEDANLADRSSDSGSGFAKWAHLAVTQVCPDIAKCVSERPQPPLKLMVLAAPDEVEAKRDALQKALGDAAHVVVSEKQGGVIEVLPPGTSKGAAIAGVVTGETKWAAFGDGQNDVEMLSSATTSFAMGNCITEACKAGKAVIGTNDTDAIAAAIREQVLTPECTAAP
jgi:Cof subfamily protein (haloacid dehalogenase superfamily)